jgi:DnaJ family protein A protein 2
MFLFDRPPVQPRQAPTHKYYKLLDVPLNASLVDIKAKFKKKAFVYHPDKGGDPTKFALLREAYEVLSDTKKRKFYDQHGDAGLEHLQETEKPRRRAATSSIVMTLPLSEFYTGVEKKMPYSQTVICMNCAGKGSRSTISCTNCSGTGMAETTYRVGPMVFQNRGTCGVCSGSGESFSSSDRCSECLGQRVVRAQKELDVCVKPGTPTGHRITFVDAADQEPGVETGDLVVVLQEEPHSIFKRIGEDLIASVPVSLSAALCGDSSSFELLDGQFINIQPPPDYIIKPGTIGSIPGKGMPCYKGDGRGTLYLKFKIVFPEQLPPRSRQLVKLILPGGGESTKASLSEVVTWTVASSKDLPHSQHEEEEVRFFSPGENEIEGCRQQ